MPRPRFEQLDGEKKDRLMEAAAKAFAERGFEGASLNQILEEAGVSKGAAYYYFDDKLDLYMTVLEHYLQHSMEAAAFDLEQLTAESFWPAVDLLMRKGMELGLQHPWIVQLGKSAWKLMRDERVLARAGAKIAVMMNLVEGIVSRGQALGVVRTDLPKDLLLDLVMVLDEAGDRWFAEHYETESPEELERVSTIMFRLFRTALSPERPAGEGGG